MEDSGDIIAMLAAMAPCLLYSVTRAYIRSAPSKVGVRVTGDWRHGNEASAIISIHQQIISLISSMATAWLLHVFFILRLSNGGDIGDDGRDIGHSAWREA